jgi:hypothetical protein
VFVQINDQGNRDRERSLERPPGTLRIAVLGSSTTAGLEVEQQQTYTALLEQMLSRPGAPVEVLNFAVEGYGAAQDFYTLRDEVWKFHPQIVMDEISLKQYVLNSTRKFSTTSIPYPYFQPAGDSVVPDPMDQRATRPTTQQISESNRIRDAVNSVDLALLATSAIKEIGLKRKSMTHLASGRGPAAADPRLDPWRWTLIPPPSPEIELGWRVLENLVLMMRDDAAKHGAEFWVIVSDDAFQVNPDPGVAETLRLQMRAQSLMYGDDRFEGFLSAHHVQNIHLEPALSDYVQRTKAYLHGGPKMPPGEGHWNALGHKVVAQIIAADLLRDSVLTKEWWAKIPPPVNEITQAARLGHEGL